MLFLSLFSFFANQRRHWFDNTRHYPKEYVAGGWAALLQAETAFNKGPLYNAHLETLEVKKELEEVRYKFTLAREKWEKEEAQRLSAKQLLKEAHSLSQHDKRHAARVRRVLERMAEVAGLTEYEPEVRMRYIQELIKQSLENEQAENRENQPQ